jgi:hypothetical protein
LHDNLYYRAWRYDVFAFRKLKKRQKKAPCTGASSALQSTLKSFSGAIILDLSCIRTSLDSKEILCHQGSFVFLTNNFIAPTFLGKKL